MPRIFIVPVPFVHCATHNLNAIINDAADATVEGISFFGAIRNVFNFFGRDLNTWAAIALTEDNLNTETKEKLSWLCSNRYTDILQVLVRISLTNEDCKERADDADLRKNKETFDIIVCINI